MKALKRVLVGIVVLIVAAIVIYFISFVVICPAINDARANKIEKEFLDLSLPSQTEVIETFSICHNSSGTGNHVEIWAGFLIKSELPEAELSKWAETIKLPYAMYDPMFWKVPEDLSLQYPAPHDFIQFKHFNGMTEAKGYYIIGYYFDPVTQHDIRGH